MHEPFIGPQAVSVYLLVAGGRTREQCAESLKLSEAKCKELLQKARSHLRNYYSPEDQTK